MGWREAEKALWTRLSFLPSTHNTCHRHLGLDLDVLLLGSPFRDIPRRPSPDHLELELEVHFRFVSSRSISCPLHRPTHPASCVQPAELFRFPQTRFSVNCKSQRKELSAPVVEGGEQDLVYLIWVCSGSRCGLGFRSGGCCCGWRTHSHQLRTLGAPVSRAALASRDWQTRRKSTPENGKHLWTPKHHSHGVSARQT